MNVEKTKIENKVKDDLVNLRSELQNTNFTIDGKRQAICTNDAIMKMAYYLPKTISELSNISGIGSTFIEKYGEQFLNIIRTDSYIKGEELTDDEKEILLKLENRLVNLNQNNKLLYCGKLNNSFGIDLFKYVEQMQELESFLINQNTSKFKLITIENIDNANEKQILKLMRTAEKNEIESGNNELYIGYPFIQGKIEDIIKAPLVIFPVVFKREKNEIYLLNDSTRDILFNSTLILANNKYNGKNEILPDNVFESINKDCFKEDINKYYENNKFYLNIKDIDIKPEKFLETKKIDFPNYANEQFDIKGYFILGLFSTYSTSLYEDFHNIINSNEITSIIKGLISGNENSQNSIDSLSQNKEHIINDDLEVEEEIQYINNLDYSQEQVLKSINNIDSIVIQGPPGTGKSQTITSIIAQCILQNKKVLMVSEKKTALDVIVSRLKKLANFTILIDDIENKKDFYNQINNVLQNINSNLDLINELKTIEDENKNKIKEEINIINQNIDYLNNIASKIYEPTIINTSMYTIYNSCNKINLKNKNELNTYHFIIDNLSDTIKNLNFNKLLEIKNKLDNDNLSKKISNYLEIVNNNKWILNIKSNLTEREKQEFANSITDLSNYLKEYNAMSFFKRVINKTTLKSKIKLIEANFFDNYITKEANKIIIKNLEFIYNFLPSYDEFECNRFIFNSFNEAEKEYIGLISLLITNNYFDFNTAVKTIFNDYLFSIIDKFESENSDILKYINNFAQIRSEIDQNIEERRKKTLDLAYLNLLHNSCKLNENDRISKIFEMTERKRKMSINKFMDKYKFELLNSVQIWLMTPEVVSNILPLEKNLFDMVIFDEASQLFIEKAIPAIYRAKSVIIAGDQKQLKPSSLFQGRIEDEEDTEEKYDGFLEYESLLDAAKFKFKPIILEYHYRSKYEELIDFSNYAFYQGKLLVTTLANAKDTKPIEMIKVNNGLWSNRQNLAEAQEIVRLVKQILETRKNNETIGVITFNSSQMDLIENLIEKEKIIDSKFEIEITNEKNRIDNNQNVGFFVKNIESVQGDERDIIIFCIGYARNEQGRIAINFGTLNQDGGENRLNVAITRAKQKIYIITSIDPEELETDYSKNNGPKLFKEYLRYAKAVSNGNQEQTKNILINLLDITDKDVNNQASFDSVFEEEVYDRLIKDNFNVETQYGVGGYRIDLVIKDSNNKNILGLECDGRQYHSSKSARERDIYRQRYLESRGWKIYRIWSTNWWRNPELEYQKLKKYIESI